MKYLCFLARALIGPAPVAAAPLLLCSFVLPLEVDAASTVPLPVEAVLATKDIDSVAGIIPSPDGQWLAYDVSDPRQSLSYDYPSQMYTSSGYPMSHGLAVYRTHMMSVVTGESMPLQSEKGSSWSGSWSPDGRLYAFYSDRSGTSTVWVWDRASRQTRQVSTIVARNFRSTDRPLWSPDGRRLLFKAVPEGMTLLDLHRINLDYQAKVAKPGGTSSEPSAAASIHVYKATSNEEAPEQGDSDGYRRFMDYRYLSDLVAVDVANGAVSRIARRVHPLYYAFSPNGSRVAALNIRGPIPNIQPALFTLDLYSTSGDVARQLAEVVPDDPAEFTWSPDGNHIAYASRAGRDYKEWRCYIVNSNTGSKTDICAALGEFNGMFQSTPFWSRDGRFVYLRDAGGQRDQGVGRLWEVTSDGKVARELGRIPGRTIRGVVLLADRTTFWSPNDQTMIVRTHSDKTKMEGFYAIDVRSGDSTRLREAAVVIHGPLVAAAADRRRFAFVQEDAGHPPEVWGMDVQTKRARQLSRLNPQMAGVTTGRVELIEYTSLAGEKLKGALLLPAGYEQGKRYPLVVWVYGGHLGSNKLNSFGFGWGAVFNMQMLASRGYAVLYPDIPLHAGTPVGDLVSATIPAVNKVIESGIADGDRLAVMGQSFGGYNTLSLITQTTRFKAAVMTASAAADLFEGYSRFQSGTAGWIGYYEQGQGGMGGTPWQYPQRYFENSPFFFLDRVTTPLLIARGSEDEIASGNGSVFASLNRLGKDVTFVEYDREGHTLQQPAHIADFWQRRLEFFDRHLGELSSPEASARRPSFQ